MVLSQFHMSLPNAIPLTFSLKKCATVRTFADFGIRSCPVLRTSSKGFSLLSISRHEPSPSMLHKPQTTFCLLARAFSTFCSRFLYPTLMKLFLAFLLPANISYPMPLQVFPAGSYERSYGGCLYDTPTSYSLTRFRYLN